MQAGALPCLTFILLMALVPSTTAKDEAVNAVNSPCAEKRFNQLLAESFEAKITRAEQSIEDARTTIRAWTILKEKAETAAAKAAFTVLIAYGQQQIDKTEAKLSSEKHKLTRAANMQRERAANITTAFLLQSSTIITTGAAAHTDPGGLPTGKDVHCNYTTATITAETAKCDPNAPSTAQLTAEKANPEEMTKLSTMADAYTSELGFAIGVYSKARPSDGITNVGHGMCQHETGADAAVGGTQGLGAKLTRKGTHTPQQKLDIGLKQPHTPCPHEEQTEQTTDLQLLANAVCHATQVKIAEHKN
uniref:Variant surface glycoprotein 1125.5458 n=1 Tax=Trypanosoma brucei TaxID=5691 RepID=A0A1J0RCV9_9TRYP|nr:variant surface glycoprotein 1125.5458 [Trypanosoma brucei]